MMDFIRENFLRIGDDDAWNTPYGKATSSIYDKIVRGRNKNGIYYLWQLKNSNGQVVADNILKEWGGNA